MRPKTSNRRHAYLATLLAAGLVAVFTLVPTTAATAMTPDTAFENCIRDKTNAARAAAGVQQLQTRSEMVNFARNHTAEMIAADDLYHSSDLTKATTGWSKLGENVGRGSSCDSLHNAFMNSAGHRANLLDPVYTSIGVGGAQAPDGRMYVTVVFAAHTNATTTTTAPPPTTTAPPPTTTAPPPPTTTTMPPTTTTTTLADPLESPGSDVAPFLEGPGMEACAAFLPFMMAAPCTGQESTPLVAIPAIVM